MTHEWICVAQPLTGLILPSRIELVCGRRIAIDFVRWMTGGLADEVEFELSAWEHWVVPPHYDFLRWERFPGRLTTVYLSHLGAAAGYEGVIHERYSNARDLMLNVQKQTHVGLPVPIIP